jgi:hypothetical protein
LESGVSESASATPATPVQAKGTTADRRIAERLGRVFTEKKGRGCELTLETFMP